MALITKPNMQQVWASGGDIVEPSDPKKQQGWTVEVPPHQFENWIQNRQDEYLAHINQRGIPAWDGLTNYEAGGLSYVQGSDGKVYKSVAASGPASVVSNPTTDLTDTYWIIAFASAGDFYTKAEVDGAFLSKAANGSDILNTTTFRNNISVYSQSQTYTKAEVDNKTTVASTLQAQQQTSNTVLLSALRLAEAFKGGNQSLLGTGFQRLPGGLIIQWGSLTQNRGTTVNHTFPLTFPNVAITIVACKGAVITVAGESTAGADILSNSQFTVTNSGAGSPSQGIRWVAIGY